MITVGSSDSASRNRCSMGKPFACLQGRKKKILPHSDQHIIVLKQIRIIVRFLFSLLY